MVYVAKKDDRCSRDCWGYAVVVDDKWYQLRRALKWYQLQTAARVGNRLFLDQRPFQGDHIKYNISMTSMGRDDRMKFGEAIFHHHLTRVS